MKRSLSFLAFVIALCVLSPLAWSATGCDGSGNCYIYAAATGSGTGASWTNAYTGFGTGTGKVNPASMTRGVTYWIAAGSYGAQTFSTAASGSTVITLEGATTASHGPDSTWSNSYAGQAEFSGVSGFSTSYWTVNGQAVPGCSYPSNNTACYTIFFANPTNGSAQAILLGGATVTSYTLEYIEVEGTNTVGSSYSDEGIACNQICDQTYIGYSWIHNVGADNLSFNYGAGGDVLTLEYNWISYNHVGLNATHAQCIQFTVPTVTFRYNLWQDCQSSGAITDAAGSNEPITEWDIYGNIFFWDAAWNTEYYGNDDVDYDDGIVGIFSASNDTGLLHFYNNTIAGLNLSSSQNCNGDTFYVSTGGIVATVENNVWYNFNANCSAGSGGTADYNAYYTVAGGVGDSGSHSYNGGASTDPFTNPTANTVAGFLPTTPDPFVSHPGVTLASPYNMDMNGVTRGANGTWDRGALQISGSAAALAPPSNLTATVQ